MSLHWSPERYDGMAGDIAMVSPAVRPRRKKLERVGRGLAWGFLLGAVVYVSINVYFGLHSEAFANLKGVR